MPERARVDQHANAKAVLRGVLHTPRGQPDIPDKVKLQSGGNHAIVGLEHRLQWQLGNQSGCGVAEDVASLDREGRRQASCSNRQPIADTGALCDIDSG
eukprot:2808700-Rhodomonas_salina.1